jgi:hypothetical protein
LPNDGLYRPKHVGILKQRWVVVFDEYTTGYFECLINTGMSSIKPYTDSNFLLIIPILLRLLTISVMQNHCGNTKCVLLEMAQKGKSATYMTEW